MTTRSDPGELRNFQLGSLLGEGADLQAFAARDARSGERVVVKRPHPSLVSRDMHREIERRIALQAQVRETLGHPGSLARLHALTEPDAFAWYFGDDLRHPYSVQVEERARGVPLVGSVADAVRGHPVALPLNLFVLHPSAEYVALDRRNPAFAALGVMENCHQLGYLARDLGPQNVFYSPGSDAATLIDLGALEEPAPATARRPPLDLNDALFDVFQSYATPQPPPGDPARFGQASEFRSSGPLERRAKALSTEYANTASAAQREPAARILARISDRDYQSVPEFRQDFELYLAAANSTPKDQAANDAWNHALAGLKAPYWRKYLFNPDEELSRFI